MSATPPITDQVFKTVPYAHQLEALTISRDKINYALLMEMGTGKTKVTIDTVSYLYGMGKINALLVVAPKTICRNWANKEIPTHLPEHVDRRVVLWRSENKTFLQELETLHADEPMKLHVLVMNIEALATDRGYKEAKKFLNGHQAMMVVDESTTIKTHNAQRTKKVIDLGAWARYRRILTGTPVTQSPLDVWSQFEFLEPGILGSSTWQGFRNQYAVLRKRVVNGRKFDEIVAFQRLDELQKSLKEISFRALKSECLDLPEKVYTVRYIEMTPKQKTYYEQMRDEAMAYLNGGPGELQLDMFDEDGNPIFELLSNTTVPGDVVAAPLVITQLLRLRQALCNIAPAETGWQPIDTVDPRVDEVLEVLKQSGGQKAIIWANFIGSIELIQHRIQAEFGYDSVKCIMGSVKQKERGNIVDEFQDMNSPLKFIVAQPRTGGYGLTLTAATLVIYHDNDWSLEVRQQSEDRAHRIGQRNTVTYVDIVVPNTVDEKVRDALVIKKDLADRVTGDKLRELLS